MDTVKFENTEIIEAMDSEVEAESPPLSEDSESCYEHLRQTGIQICTDDYSGQFKFDFTIDQTEISKKHWMFSETLNKVYIDMNRVLPVQFRWQFDKIDLLRIKILRIRALPIFATPESEQLSIKRCPVHVMQDTNCDGRKAYHIIWCEQPDAIYEEDPYSQRYSVVAIVQNPFPDSDIKTYNLLYKFMCKSSCSMSLNRRPINVIFTLETLQGQVLGRKKLGVKVCSCPRRDMLKEENIEKKKLVGYRTIKKRTMQVNDTIVHNSKIPKINNDANENKMYELPKLSIPGKRLFINTLELLHGHFLGTAVREDQLIDSHPLISMLSDLISKVQSDNENNDNE